MKSLCAATDVMWCLRQDDVADEEREVYHVRAQQSHWFCCRYRNIPRVCSGLRARVRGLNRAVSHLGPADAVPSADKSSQVDTLFLEYRRGDTPGAAVVVVQGGKPIFQKAMAWLVSTRSCTASAILDRLAYKSIHGDGRDDPARKGQAQHRRHDRQVPAGLPERRYDHSPATTHPHFRRSGTGPGSECFRSFARNEYPARKAVRHVWDEPLEFSPGERWSYTNAGYIVLGYLIEKVSGQPYGTFLRENIFAPLGMNDTGYDHPGTILKHRAAGYWPRRHTYKNAMYFDMSLFGPSGALYSTIEDMVLWDQALDAGKLVKPELLRQGFSPAKLNDGSLVKHYGFGWVLGSNRGLAEVRATGMMPGFAAQIVRIPSERVSVIILSNCNALPVLDLAHKIAEIYLGPARLRLAGNNGSVCRRFPAAGVRVFSPACAQGRQRLVLVMR